MTALNTAKWDYLCCAFLKLPSAVIIWQNRGVWLVSFSFTHLQAGNHFFYPSTDENCLVRNNTSLHTKRYVGGRREINHTATHDARDISATWTVMPFVSVRRTAFQETTNVIGWLYPICLRPRHCHFQLILMRRTQAEEELYKSCKTGHHVRKIWVIATLITSLLQVEERQPFFMCFYTYNSLLRFRHSSRRRKHPFSVRRYASHSMTIRSSFPFFFFCFGTAVAAFPLTFALLVFRSGNELTIAKNLCSTPFQLCQRLLLSFT